MNHGFKPVNSSKTVKVGVLSPHNSKETKAILNAVEDLGHDPVWLRNENTEIRIENGETVLSPEVDVIVNRVLLSNGGGVCEAVGLVDICDEIKPVLNKPSAVLKAVNKFSTAVALSKHGVSVPDAFMSPDQNALENERPRFGDEVVYKAAIGTHGEGTWKLDRDSDTTPRIGDRYTFLQELLESDEDSSDIRMYVVGGEVVGAMRRYPSENEWRTNVALGGQVESYEPSKRAREIALQATEILGLDYAGIDMMKRGNKWYVLEVNPTAGFKGLFSATGISPAPYIAELALDTVGESTDPERIEDISRQLDDSVPDAKPDTEKNETERKMIGYTERVSLAGTEGSKSVIAKSDTGASRTSIDMALAAEIGVGPIKSISRVRSGSSSGSKSRPVVDLAVNVRGDRHAVTASIEDREHMDYPVILGRDILEDYRVDVKMRAEE